MKKTPEPAKAEVHEIAPATLYRLDIDHDGVYWGSTAIAIEEAKEGDVHLNHAPDNPPGKYRWVRANAEHPGRFEPLPEHAQKAAPGAPTLEQAFFDLLQALDPAVLKVPFPPRLSAWVLWFEKTLDARRDKA